MKEKILKWKADRSIFQYFPHIHYVSQMKVSSLWAAYNTALHTIAETWAKDCSKDFCLEILGDSATKKVVEILPSGTAAYSGRGERCRKPSQNK